MRVSSSFANIIKGQKEKKDISSKRESEAFARSFLSILSALR